jgi:hypothetical protein
MIGRRPTTGFAALAADGIQFLNQFWKENRCEPEM